VRGVLGFKLEIRDFHFAQKLSQERTEDRAQVIAHLAAGDANEKAVAAAMQQLNKPV
jgi:predicted FMN-binding regulatory protein PaiB